MRISDWSSDVCSSDLGQTVLRGAGETQLQVTLDRISRRHGVAVEVLPRAIPYRETLAAPAEVEGRHKKQSGGRGQFGVVNMRFEDRKSGVSGKSVAVRVAIGGRRYIKKKKQTD